MTIEILPRSFATALKSVAYAMSTDTTKTWLNRILVECTGRELVLVATDGHRLAKAAIPMADEQDKWQATIPGANVSDLVKAVSAQAKGKGLLTVSKHRIESPAGQFEFDTAEMFPPYAQVIPQQSEVSVEYAESVELTTVTGALKTANKRQNGTVHSVGNELRFSADVNACTAIRANVGCGQINGTIKLTGFCLAYLHDAAKSLKGFAARLQWSGELDPLVIKSRVDTIDLTAVVMPVRI